MHGFSVVSEGGVGWGVGVVGDKWLNNVYTKTGMKKHQHPSTLSPHLQHLGKALCWPES